MSDSTKTRLSFSFGDLHVELEGNETFVESKFSHLVELLTHALEGNVSTSSLASAALVRSHGSTDRKKERRDLKLRGFLKERAPGNVYAAIAIVLDYKRTHENAGEVTSDEIHDSLKLAGYTRLPSNFAQALTDCRRKYEYIEAGSRRGMWRLGPKGETFMNAASNA